MTGLSTGLTVDWSRGNRVGIKNGIRQIPSMIVFLLTAVFVLFPIFWIGLTSFKRPIDALTPKLIFEPTLQNFQTVFSPPHSYGPLIVNSITIAAGTVVISVPLAAMGAYALSRYRFRGKGLLMVSVLATQFLPPVVVVLPFFLQFRALGLLDTQLALIIVNISHTLPFTMWLLKGFVDTLPPEIEEAAFVEGCNGVQVLRHITVPLILPGIYTSAVYAFILAWNEFLFAIILSSHDARTVIIGMAALLGEQGVPWELLSAGGMIIMVPMLVMAFGIRRYFVEGLTMGAVK